MKRLTKMALSTAAGLLTASAVMASPVLMQHTFGPGQDGNDCSGYFGSGFDSCQIFVYEDGKRHELSPSIVKYDYEDEGVVTTINNTLYPSFDDSKISMDLKYQTWDYTPGDDDPGIRFWAAKGGSYFNLLWYVDEADAASCAGDAYKLACMNNALTVTEGSWTTPINPSNDKPYSLSHLTFYNSVAPTHVPEPGTAALLLVGAAGLFMARRRRMEPLVS